MLAWPPCRWETGETQEGRMKTTESESSGFRDLCVYGDEGLRFERHPMVEGSTAVAAAADQNFIVSKSLGKSV